MLPSQQRLLKIVARRDPEGSDYNIADLADIEGVKHHTMWERVRTLEQHGFLEVYKGSKRGLQVRLSPNGIAFVRPAQLPSAGS